MAGNRFVPNRSFERQQNAQPDTQRALDGVARTVAKEVSGLAPRGFMGIRRTIRAGRAGTDAAVFAGPGWHLAEFGTVRTSPRAPFRRALDRLGLKMTGGRGGF